MLSFLHTLFRVSSNSDSDTHNANAAAKSSGSRHVVWPFGTRPHVTCHAPSGPGFGQLPVEIVIYVVCQLHLPDIVRCRLLSKHFREIIDGCHEIQLTIELQIGGYDAWCGLPASSAEQLRYLSTLRRRWKNPSLSQGPELPQHILSRMSNKRYYGNVFVGCSRTHTLSDPRWWNIICCMCIETRDQYIGNLADVQDNFVISDWEMQFADEFETFAVDPARQLLILLRFRPGNAPDLHWWYEIQVASLITGEVHNVDGSAVIRVRAPCWRHFYETPGLQVQDDLVGISTGRMRDTESERQRFMEITIVNFRTGHIVATISRQYPRQLEPAVSSFIFVSHRSLLLARSGSRCFSIELYALPSEQNTDSDSDTRRATHVATYDFPRLQRGRTSNPFQKALVKSYLSSLSLHLPLPPCTPAPTCSTIQIHREYYRRSQDPLRVCTVIPLSLFLSAEHRYFEAETTGEVHRPLLLPWEDWGPSKTRAFSSAVDQVVGSHGSRLIVRGDKVYDFNIWGVCRELQQEESNTLPNPLASSLDGNTRDCIRRVSRAVGVKPRAKRRTTDPSNASRSSASNVQVVRSPNLIPHDDVFMESVLTSLPYTETRVHWDRRQHMLIYGGDAWVAYANSSAYASPYAYTLAAAAL